MAKEFSSIDAIRNEMESVGERMDIGMLCVKSANRAIADAALRPDPRALYLELWYEGETSCLFADSNLGKSIFAVQIAAEIALTEKVLLVDCELSDKQFQLRYTNPLTGQRHLFPDNLLRAEIIPDAIEVKDFEEYLLHTIEQVSEQYGAMVIIIDNLTYLCNSSDKGVDAGLFMMKLMALKKKHRWSLLIIAHTPKRSLSSPITQNDLAGSKKLFNFFDSVFAIGRSAADEELRYIKQLKVRAGAFKYDSSNVIVCEIVKEDDGNLLFHQIGFAKEREHLSEKTEKDTDVRDQNILELVEQNKTYKEISNILGVSTGLISKVVSCSRQSKNPVNG